MNPVLDILSDIRTENQTAPRISRTEQDRTELYGSVLSVLVLQSSSEQNFGNTTSNGELRSRFWTKRVNIAALMGG